MIAVVIANANRGKGRPFKLEDFMPRTARSQGAVEDKNEAILKALAGYVPEGNGHG